MFLCLHTKTVQRSFFINALMDFPRNERNWKNEPYADFPRGDVCFEFALQLDLRDCLNY